MVETPNGLVDTNSVSRITNIYDIAPPSQSYSLPLPCGPQTRFGGFVVYAASFMAFSFLMSLNLPYASDNGCVWPSPLQ